MRKNWTYEKADKYINISFIFTIIFVLPCTLPYLIDNSLNWLTIILHIINVILFLIVIPLIFWFKISNESYEQMLKKDLKLTEYRLNEFKKRDDNINE